MLTRNKVKKKMAQCIFINNGGKQCVNIISSHTSFCEIHSQQSDELQTIDLKKNSVSFFILFALLY